MSSLILQQRWAMKVAQYEVLGLRSERVAPPGLSAVVRATKEERDDRLSPGALIETKTEDRTNRQTVRVESSWIGWLHIQCNGDAS
jgi:hypothetical protein